MNISSQSSPQSVHHLDFYRRSSTNSSIYPSSKQSLNIFKYDLIVNSVSSVNPSISHLNLIPHSPADQLVLDPRLFLSGFQFAVDLVPDSGDAAEECWPKGLSITQQILRITSKIPNTSSMISHQCLHHPLENVSRRQ